MKFRMPELSDKNEVLLYIKDHYSHNEKSLSATNMLTSMDYAEWVKKIHDNVTIGHEQWGKSYTYLAFSEENQLVGFLNIRFELAEELALRYGHIGYGVKPNERRKGYAGEILIFALEKCRELGLRSVVLGCYKENIGSARTIIKNGGKLIKEVMESKKISDYWEIELVDQFYEIKLEQMEEQK